MKFAEYLIYKKILRISLDNYILNKLIVANFIQVPFKKKIIPTVIVIKKNISHNASQNFTKSLCGISPFFLSESNTGINYCQIV